ncbi:MAG: NapC/NirT family cytochrome c [Bacillota bacterium]
MKLPSIVRQVHLQAGNGGGRLRIRSPLLIGAVIAITFLVGGVHSVNSATKEASFCVSCHVMEPAYGTWSHSAHREVVDCGGCHSDQRNYLTKTYSKAMAGAKHMYVYALGDIPPRIRIAKENTALVQQNCLRCHGEVARNLQMDADRRCTDCHRFTPHGNIR